jgi:hypothetical protein
VDSRRDRQPACGFCDGTGLWPDPGGDPDPCPLCDGAGVAPGAPPEEPQAPETGTLPRLIAVLPRLSQADRQRLYEELHGRYDCRIYR